MDPRLTLFKEGTGAGSSVREEETKEKKTDIFKELAFVDILLTAEEKKKMDVFIDAYEKAIPRITSTLRHLMNELKTKYIDIYPEPTSNPYVNSFISWVPGASKLGWRTNQSYAKTVRQLSGFALMHIERDYTNLHFYVLSCLEKIVKLYLSHSSDLVSKFVREAIEGILGKIPHDLTEWEKMRLTLSKRFSVPEEVPELKLSEGSISALSTLSHEEYLQAERTWKGVRPESDPPRPTVS